MIAAGADDEAVAAQLLMTARRGESWVVERLVAAARAAEAQGSSDGAVSYLTRALEEPPPEAQRPPLLLALGHGGVADQRAGGRRAPARRLRRAGRPGRRGPPRPPRWRSR